MRNLRPRYPLPSRLNRFLFVGLIITTALVATVGLAAATAPANDAAAKTAPLHGGVVTKVSGQVFETLLAPDGVRVWFYAGNAAPANVGNAQGTVKVTLADGRSLDLKLAARKPTAGEPAIYYCPMHAEVVQREPGQCKICGGMKLYTQDALFAAADLAKVAPNTAKAQVHLTGLDASPAEVTFAPVFAAPAADAAHPKAGR